MDRAQACGFSFWRPKGIQKYATTRSFMIFYGILGALQMMTVMYSTMTLTTLERRFKIPSATTGFVFGGNDVSQVLFSLILSHMGGQHNRPRWIAWGGAMSALACLVMGGSHFYFGPGDDAIQLTEEYLHRNDMNLSIIETKTTFDTEHKLCHSEPPEDCSSDDQQIASMFPLILIFCTRFVLGIGLTLYLTLGTPYLDDGVKRKNTPIMLATAFTFKMFGSFAFILINISLRMYVDPWSTPVITQSDPRWIGAWWFGYIVLGIGMAMVSVFIGIFPKQLPRSTELTLNAVKQNDGIIEEEIESLHQTEHKIEPINNLSNDIEYDNFVVALKRLLKNRLVMFKLTAEIFYVLASTAMIVYYSQFMEVMFNRSAADASIVTGPIDFVLAITSCYLAALIIGKSRPSYRILMLCSILVSSLLCMLFIFNMFWPCDTTSIVSQFGSVHLKTSCNSHCSCEKVSFSPVCDNDLKTTFFSPCHAGCNSWNESERLYGGCSCVDSLNSKITTANRRSYPIHRGACFTDCSTAFYTYVILFSSINAIGAGVNIGRSLIDMRVVEDKDKSFASGLSLWTISIFAMIPGRIIYGYIIDSTCIIWNEKCGHRGNCQLYDQKLFRNYINGMAALLTIIGSCFEGLACFYGKNTQLYELS